MTTTEKVDALRRSPLFELLAPAELEVLAELSRPYRFATGETVFEAGDRGAALYVLVSGAVEVLARAEGRERLLGAREAPASFGEMALVDREVRSATVRATAPVVALELTAENFTAFRKRSRDGFTFVVLNIARVLSGRLREASHALALRN